MKKVLIQTEEQLELVRQEIRVSSLFSHPNLLPLLDHAIIGVKVILLNVPCYFMGFLGKSSPSQIYKSLDPLLTL